MLYLHELYGHGKEIVHFLFSCRRGMAKCGFCCRHAYNVIQAPKQILVSEETAHYAYPEQWVAAKHQSDYCFFHVFPYLKRLESNVEDRKSVV